MCPQVIYQTKQGLIAQLTNDILSFLTLNRGKLFSSHELDQAINSVSYNTLKARLSSYPASGFAEPSSHLGALCAHLGNSGLLKHTTKYCSVLNRNEDAFCI